MLFQGVLPAWQVFVQAEGEYRTRAENVGFFFVRNSSNENGPAQLGHERAGRDLSHHAASIYRAAQINATAAADYSGFRR